MSELENARLDALDREAEALEERLYGGSGKLISKDRRKELKAKLASLYADMGRSVERLAASMRKEPHP